MSRYQIAELMVDMQPLYPLLTGRAAPYLARTCGTQDADITIPLLEDRLNQQALLNPQLSCDEWEYLLAGSAFYRNLLSFHGMMLHASAVCYHRRSYLFSAPSGTGKSTHAQQWLARFGSAVSILNDDKPAIRLKDDGFWVYGTPFSGKTDLNQNRNAPLQAICMLERGEKNKIWRLTSEEAIFSLLHQTLHRINEARMQQLLSLLDELLRRVPIYKMKCNVSPEAAEMAYQAMKP